MGCTAGTASQAEFGQGREREPPKETSTLHFTLKESPAILSFRGDSYLGKINPNAKVCWVSFPGKYSTAWESLISQHHDDSVACVFLDDTDNGLGQHHFPNDNREQCLCAEIYGERNYKDLGYLQEVQDTCSESERAQRRERAKAMNSHIVFGKASDEDRKQAKELWKKNKKRASWGCAWFEKWFHRVKTAVDLGQRLKVVYFPGQVGCGKVAWTMLPKVNLWDGNGCGGSQKSEIAKLDEMRRIDRSGRWNYDEVDVTDFLTAQFNPGDIVDAFDSDQNTFVTAKLTQMPDKNHIDMKWQVVCKKTGKSFKTKHLRHATDFFEKLLDVFAKDSLEQIVRDATKLNVKSIYESRLQNGRLSLAVDFNIQTIQESHRLRDAVLSDDLALSLNKALEKRGFAEQLAVENTVFFQQYAASLLTLSQLTDHQTEKLKQLSRYLHEDVHLSAPAGGGKTFLAIRHTINKLRLSSKGKILFISPNRPLCFHFVHWLIMHARFSLPKVSRNKLLQRLVLMHAPYDRITRAQIAADSYIVLEELKAMPEDLVLAIFDEAHAIFRTNQGIFQEVRAQRKLILSDRSQAFLLETKYPEMRRVILTEIVRSTKRIVCGANAFHLQDDEPITCLGTTGPPLKSFIFESPKGYDDGFFEQFADQTVKALWFIMCTHPNIRLDRHVALLVPDEEFYRSFRFHLEERLESAFTPTYNMKLVSFEDSLRFLPEAHQDLKRDELVLDWDGNATGLETLFVVCIGFDVQITGEHDNFTRARLYHAIPRAQLQALVVDRLVHDGWLQYLTTLKLRETTFRLDGAESEINKAAALKIVKEAAQSEADSKPEAAAKESTFRLDGAESEINKAAALKIVKEAAQSEADSNSEAATKETTFRLHGAESEINKAAALKIVKEAAQSEADSNSEAATKATSPLTLRGSWVWDTSANTSKADIGKLRFDPLEAQEVREAREAQEAADAEEAADCGYDIARAVSFGRFGAVRHILRTRPGAVASTEDDGWTVLHDAAGHGRVEICQVLLAAGAEVHARDDVGQTPLHYAAGNGRVEVVQLLVEAKTSVTVTNSYGQTPLDYARRAGNDEVVKILKNAA